MEKRDVKHTSIFLIAEELSKDTVLSVQDGNQSVAVDEKVEDETPERKNVVKESSFITCNACKVTIEKEKKTEHYSSELHRINVKLRAAGIKRMTGQEYESLKTHGGKQFSFFFTPFSAKIKFNRKQI